MIKTLKWEPFKGWKIRILSAFRCLFKTQYVLVCWDLCDDGEVDFKITHKGATVQQAVHRLKVDAVEILQDICDQESALDEIDDILKR